ncbi:MAG: PulJ/GspJ family protein [Giesbergeria sp.]
MGTAQARRAQRGFTLIELLIAIALLGMMALMSWSGIDGMVRAQQHTRERSDALLTLQVALGQWGADLDAILPLPNTTPIDWDGQALRITRRSSAGPGEGALVVAWSQRNVNGTDRWLRWQSAPVTTRGQWQQAWDQAGIWARSAGEAERRGEVALLPLTGWQIFYFRGNAWTNPLSSSTPTAQNVGQASAAAQIRALVPDGIRLQLDLAPGQALAGQLTRDWVNPLSGGGKS